MHNLVGLDNGAMLLLGGVISRTPQSTVWQLKNDKWTNIGELFQVFEKEVSYKNKYFRALLTDQLFTQEDQFIHFLDFQKTNRFRSRG